MKLSRQAAIDRGILVVSVISGILLLLTGCEGEKGTTPARNTYQTYIAPDRTFSVDFLANLVIQERMAPPNGRGYGASGDQIDFMVRVDENGPKDFHNEVSRSEYALLLIEFFLEEFGMSSVSNEVVRRPDGVITRTIAWSPRARAIVEMYVQDHRTIMLVAEAGSPERLKRQSVRRFFESFRFLQNSDREISRIFSKR